MAITENLDYKARCDYYQRLYIHYSKMYQQLFDNLNRAVTTLVNGQQYSRLAQDSMYDTTSALQKALEDIKEASVQMHIEKTDDKKNSN